jgi:N-acetyl-gamma-glutamyl-phosphate reductase
MARIKVIGAAGYAGHELTRILLSHPKVESLQLYDLQVKEPTPIWRLRPSLRGVTDQLVLPKDDGSEADLAFFATPDGVTMSLARGYLDRGIRVVDFSGDTRLRSAETHKSWYGIEHKDVALLSEAVYGLPEIHRDEIREARIIANPGCFPTSVTLGLAPAVSNGLVDPNTIVADCKTGISGAGNHLAPRFHFPECDNNFSAYKVTGHKHIPEIDQELGLLCGSEVKITFVPHLLPVSRGILSTLYCSLVGDHTVEEIQSVYEEQYASDPFVRVMPPGEECCLKSVQGSNFCDISVHVDKRVGRLIVTSAIDNLIKGASGQAVQNMNLALGFEETAGLMQPSVWL